ncbi:hypothetical protein POPTR_004G046501v4 [Populus trichocarpa]|uniref:Uncharacterized protein n=2 Tax=Populus trichocarpa TaxID=3694 RepID=A0A3N7GWQ2_POPTR|nr:hypothetical protein POPTR_004G046501v4 [Populus trichocarpa]
MSDKSGGGDIVRYICVDMLRSIHINVSFVQNFYFLQAYYPKCLAKCFVLIMLWFFVGASKIISCFLGKDVFCSVLVGNRFHEMLKEKR